MITIAVLIATFIAGAISAAIVLFRLAIGKEEANYSLLRKPQTRAATITRRVVGFSTEIPQR